MTTIHTLLLVGHVVVSLAIIGLVLLQKGKGAEAGAAFGSGASGTVFGAKGSANFLSRSTAVMATLFFVSSLTLAYLSSQGSAEPASLLEDAPIVEVEPEAVPDLSDEMPVSDLPSLEPTEDPLDLPSLEEEPKAPDQD